MGFSNKLISSYAVVSTLSFKRLHDLPRDRSMALAGIEALNSKPDGKSTKSENKKKGKKMGGRKEKRRRGGMKKEGGKKKEGREGRRKREKM